MLWVHTSNSALVISEVAHFMSRLQAKYCLTNTARNYLLKSCVIFLYAWDFSTDTAQGFKVRIASEETA